MISDTSPATELPDRPPRAPSRNSQRPMAAGSGDRSSPSDLSLATAATATATTTSPSPASSSSSPPPPLLPGMRVPTIQRPSPTSPFSDWEAYIVSQTQNWDEHRLKMQKAATNGRVMWADQVQPAAPASTLPGYLKARDLNDSSTSSAAKAPELRGRKSFDAAAKAPELRGRKSFDAAAKAPELRGRKSSDATALASPRSAGSASPASPPSAASTGSLRVAKLLSPKPRRSSMILHDEAPSPTEATPASASASTMPDAKSTRSRLINYGRSNRRASIHSLSSVGNQNDGSNDIGADLSRSSHFLSPTSALLSGLGAPFVTHQGKRSSASSASANGSEAFDDARRASSSTGSAVSDVRVAGHPPRPAFLEQYGLEPDSGESDEEHDEDEDQDRDRDEIAGSDGDPDTDVTTPRMEDEDDVGSKLLPTLLVGGAAADRSSRSSSSSKQARAGSRPATGTGSVRSFDSSAPVFANRDPFAMASSSSLSSRPGSLIASPVSPLGVSSSSTSLHSKKKGSSISGRRPRGSSSAGSATTSSILRSMPVGEYTPRRSDRTGSVSSMRSVAASATSSVVKKSRRGYTIEPPSEPVPPLPVSVGAEAVAAVDAPATAQPRDRPHSKTKAKAKKAAAAVFAQDDDDDEAVAAAVAVEGDVADRESILSHSSRSSSLSKVEGQILAAPPLNLPAVVVEADSDGKGLEERDTGVAKAVASAKAGLEKHQSIDAGARSRSSSRGARAQTEAEAQAEWDDLQIERFLRSVRVHMDAEQAVALLQRGELRDLLDPTEAVAGNDASSSLLELKDNVERLYVSGAGSRGGDGDDGCDSAYEAMLRRVSSVTQWEDPVVTSAAASLYALCWYRGLLLPLVFASMAALLLEARFVDVPKAADHLRATTRAQRKRIDVVDAIERSLFSASFGGGGDDGSGAGTDDDDAAAAAACSDAAAVLATTSGAVATLADLQEKARRIATWHSSARGSSLALVALLAALALASCSLSPWALTRLVGGCIGLLVFTPAPTRARLWDSRACTRLWAWYDRVPTDRQHARSVLRRRVAAAAAVSSRTE
ncbi:uncharacterized protein PFL1_04281 [Pseudozyma flocculosa PF-1]|uniref:Uncharacterized protein n=2 Tax=Pseudozyma flocculosa TaxID=84751 RepID=A0A5C3FEZ6_9BASI|nr:uncharacterized protein PFL1_04281 [Pseudozyma flocculosa PF-1]EPQ27954.1 hypothetical protein PFL1_04281 [Pseudozyma flocculosa PF-1]SPO42247.1 uncharacterized protein PSFLO_07730 [Pseudozyma flocculosa]